MLGVFDEPAETDPFVVDVGSPTRLYDSRPAGGPVAAGSVVRIDLGDHLSDPGNSAVLNLTSVLPTGPGHFTAFPCDGGVSETSNLNYGPGDVVANAVIIAPDADGEVCVSTHAASDMIVDLLGEVGEVFDGFLPLRVLDTRRR